MTSTAHIHIQCIIHLVHSFYAYYQYCRALLLMIYIATTSLTQYLVLLLNTSVSVSRCSLRSVGHQLEHMLQILSWTDEGVGTACTLLLYSTVEPYYQCIYLLLLRLLLVLTTNALSCITRSYISICSIWCILRPLLMVTEKDGTHVYRTNNTYSNSPLPVYMHYVYTQQDYYLLLLLYTITICPPLVSVSLCHHLEHTIHHYSNILTIQCTHSFYAYYQYCRALLLMHIH